MAEAAGGGLFIAFFCSLETGGPHRLGEALVVVGVQAQTQEKEPIEALEISIFWPTSRGPTPAGVPV